MDENLSQYTFPADTLSDLVRILTDGANSIDWDELHLEIRYLSDDASEVGYYQYSKGQSTIVELDDQAYFLIEDERDKLMGKQERPWRQFELTIARDHDGLGRSITLKLGYEPFTTVESLVANDQPGI